jgi:hypothetical protein
MCPVSNVNDVPEPTFDGRKMDPRLRGDDGSFVEGVTHFVVAGK